MSTPPLNPLVDKVRQKYPGAYDDMDDAALTKALLNKYPEYSDLAAPSPSQQVGLGKMPPDPIQQEIQNRQAGTLAGFPGGSPNVPSDAKAMLPGAIALGGAGAVAAPSIPLIGGAIAGAAKSLPYVAASEGINYARKNLPGGKYIPPGAELLPFFMGGGKGKAAEAEEAGAPLPEKPPASVLKANKAANAEPVYPGAPYPEPGNSGAPFPANDVSAAQLAKNRASYEAANPVGRKIPLGDVGTKPTGDPYAGKNVPEMEAVSSSNIAKIGYNPDTKKLFVEFKSGNVHAYDGVPQKVYDQFKAADSQGSFHAQYIKGNYENRRLGSVAGKK